MDDDLPEGFDMMRFERPDVARFNSAVFVPRMDWPDYKRRMEGRGAASYEEIPGDLDLLALPDFEALQRLYAGGGTPLVPYSPLANAFFIRRLPRDTRGGRIPRKHDGRRVAGWCGARCTKSPNAACGNNEICLRPIVLGVNNVGTPDTNAPPTITASSTLPAADRLALGVIGVYGILDIFSADAF